MGVAGVMCVIIIIEEPVSSNLVVGNKMPPIVAITAPADHRDELSENVVRNWGLGSRQESFVDNPSLKIISVKI